jgi:hypothetical protein
VYDSTGHSPSESDHQSLTNPDCRPRGPSADPTEPLVDDVPKRESGAVAALPSRVGGTAPERYAQIRQAFLERGEFDPELLRLLRRAVSRLVRFGGLPPIYSPTGQWDDEAERDVLGDWIAFRLWDSQLAALLHQAATPGSFLRLGEFYLRRHLINRLARSEAKNLHGRVRDLLTNDATFEPAVTEGRWQVSGQPAEPWQGTDKELLGAAYRLGHFELVRFRDNAKKLPHVLEADDLRRFVAGLLQETGCALTLADVVRALVLRFDLQPAGFERLDDYEDVIPAPVDVPDQVFAARAARAVVAELTPRQVAILHCQLRDLNVRETAAEVGVSTGTISAEQKVNAEVLSRISDEEGASRGALLNALRDLLFIEETDDLPLHS